MTQDSRLPEGAGASTGSNYGDTYTGTTGSAAGTTTARDTGKGYSQAGSYTAPASGGSYAESGGSYESRELVLAERSKPSTATVVGAAIAGAIVAGAVPFMLSGRGSKKRNETAIVEESIIVDRPARELYDFWRDFTNFPQFMDNIKSVEKLSETRSHWVIKAPVGTSVEFDAYIVEDVPGRLIAWRSEEGASVPNSGRVEFIETSGGTGTNVRTTISYDPPAGAAGRLAAKLLGREPEVQAKQDLKNFKELMEGRGRTA